jgi:hypothetical protein
MLAPFNPFTEPDGPFASFEQATDYLDRACLRLGVKHLSYWCVSYSGGAPDQVSWISTYPPEYMNHYMANYTPVGDPAFEATMTGPIVSDWDDLMTETSVQTLHQTAAKYGIARHGLSFPFRDPGKSDVLFSVNVECSAEEWPALRLPVAANMHLMARHYHRRVVPLIQARHGGEGARAA